MSHQILVPSSTALGLHQMRDQTPVLVERAQSVGQAGARQGVEHGETIGGEAGILPLQKRRGAAERQHMRQEVRDLVHQADAQIVIVDTDVNMHPADQHASDRLAQIAAQRVVAALARMRLVAPLAERMGRGGDRRIAKGLRRLGHTAPQIDQLGDGTGNGTMRFGPTSIWHCRYSLVTRS